jgi:hypothetical protein
MIAHDCGGPIAAAIDHHRHADTGIVQRQAGEAGGDTPLFIMRQDDNCCLHECSGVPLPAQGRCSDGVGRQD